MAQKITLAPSRDIPFNKLVLSQANVRRIKAGVSVEELADNIARRYRALDLPISFISLCAHVCRSTGGRRFSTPVIRSRAS